jgi:prepilin-type N-terminal cleavage/methylation domain-containing protein
MKINKLRMLANQKGFTLIELMIVIAIIGILAAVAIPNFIAYRDKSFCSAAEADANSIAASLSDYFAIPTHTSLGGDIHLTKAFDGGTAPYTATNGIKLTALSKNSSATISGGVSNITIAVTEGSGRCPNDYQSANANEWDITANVYTKQMK